jgi:transposase
LCPAHLLRELLNFEKALDNAWCIRMNELFHQALALKKSLTPEDYNHPPPEILTLNKELDGLLKVDTSVFHPKLQALVKRLVKQRESVFRFLTRPGTPADNNASERAIQNVKVKTRVSGQFRNKEGRGVADRFARLRSVIDTTVKNGREVYTALQTLAAC